MSLEVIDRTGRDGVATVFIARTQDGRLVEFVESFQPRVPLEKKWVHVLSVMHGCPVRCLMCDAGQSFNGNLSQEDILAQVDYLVTRRFPDKRVPAEKFKVQFTRMGEPAFNDAVLDVLEALPNSYDAPGLLPSVSTIAPRGRERFFERLLEIKKRHYRGGKFQMQFSVHTTDPAKRDRLIPFPKWGFDEMAAYGDRFFEAGDRKITLNFALIEGYPVDAAVLAKHFDPEKFMVKLTPLNPTGKASANGLRPAFEAAQACPAQGLVDELRARGFDALVSIGDLEENQIGSNCGQYLRRQAPRPTP